MARSGSITCASVTALNAGANASQLRKRPIAVALLCIRAETRHISHPSLLRLSAEMLRDRIPPVAPNPISVPFLTD